MPNWCYNYLEINASDKAIKALLEKAKAPSDPYETDKVREFSYLPFVRHLMPESYKTTWYEDNHTLLGCKWFPAIEDDSITKDSQSLQLFFESPWTPSTNATRHVAAWLKSEGYVFHISHAYDESGCGFCGLLVIDNDGEYEHEGPYGDLDGEFIREASDEDLESVAKEHNTTVEEIRSRLNDDDIVMLCPEFYEPYA